MTNKANVYIASVDRAGTKTGSMMKFNERLYQHKGVRAVLFLTAVLVITFFSLNAIYPINIDQRTDAAVTVYTKEGELLRQFANKQGIYRIETTVEQVSPFYLDALLEYEDKHFYDHPGVNPFSLARAIRQRVTNGRVISGGSTLTMQVARLLYPNKRSYAGKLQQIFRALQFELKYSKDEILGLYLTYAPMGGNIEGVQAASQRYFGKHAKDLTKTEAALLVVLPQRPSVYRPDINPDKAKSARDKVLGRLERANLIDSNNASFYQQEPVSRQRKSSKMLAPLLARHLKQQQPLKNSITTTINHNVQSDLESIISQRMQTQDSRLSAAVLVMDNQTGEVIAYKGSADFLDNNRFGHVDMSRAIRSPGSTLKPFIYGMAMDSGIIHSKSLLTDVPMRFGDYQPKNFDLRFDGAVSVDVALKMSKNVPVVLVLDKLTPENFVINLENAGVHLNVEQPNLSIALGGAGITLTDLVALYSSLSRQGRLIFPKTQAQQKPTEQAFTGVQILSKESAWIIKEILSEIDPPDRAAAAYHRQISWKTGTSYGYRDAWAVGTSNDYTVGVWVGRPDGAPFVGQTGAKQAGPILFDVFDLLPKDVLRIDKPEQVISKSICWPSGLSQDYVNNDDCINLKTANTIKGKTPLTIKSNGGLEQLHQWPQVLQNWMKTKEFKLQKQNQRVSILHPKDNSQMFMGSKTEFVAIANNDLANWYLNDRLLPNNIIKTKQLGQGPQTITACFNDSCDSIVVELY
ncbi:penicillin-binding protein 1C [Thalassotalea crassostreae]|uniref:penicillin-binding protein 1C n=1 Tax=Thalassotalea crassostreae TaxID=1763536 RepID=UPI0009EEE0B9|nr:penicillin-binding protein 1C [Thalassotalea crassostreae]